MKRTAAVVAAKAAGAVARRLRLGGGTALPGLIAERVDPDIVREMAAGLERGVVLVTGTNGKTTTARLLRGIVQAAGMKSVANRAGSNMMRGIAAALVESAGWSGSISARERRLGVFEVDEATLPEVARAVQPKVVLFTNLFRDQLDRYGEVEHVAALWREALAALPQTTTVVLNADDPSVASLAEVAAGRTVFYWLDDRSQAVEAIDHAADARWCSACSAELVYDAAFYGHIGHWRCASCGRSRPAPDVAGMWLVASPDEIEVTVPLFDADVILRLPLTGLYNAYNALAAAAGGFALEIEAVKIEAGIETFRPAFGRQERLRIGGRDVQVILAKNPAGLNQVIRTIGANGEEADLVLMLNDNIADGRDISWIWDVDFELLAGRARHVTVSGTRAWDMALRLKYAGLEPLLEVETDATAALRSALEGTPDGRTLYVVPTYTALLQTRDLLARWAGRGAFWQEA